MQNMAKSPSDFSCHSYELFVGQEKGNDDNNKEKMSIRSEGLESVSEMHQRQPSAPSAIASSTTASATKVRKVSAVSRRQYYNEHVILPTANPRTTTSRNQSPKKKTVLSLSPPIYLSKSAPDSKRPLMGEVQFSPNIHTLSHKHGNPTEILNVQSATSTSTNLTCHPHSFFKLLYNIYIFANESVHLFHTSVCSI